MVPIRHEFNPWSVDYAADFLISSSVSTSFVELDQNEKWSFPFCSSWKRLSEGDKITCELFEDLRWSDGSPMKPDEIIDSLRESMRTTRTSGIAQLVKKIALEPPRQVTIEFEHNSAMPLWAFTGLDQAILDPEARAQIRTIGFLNSGHGLKRGSGRFRLNAVNSGHVNLEPNPYFPTASSRATLPVEIIGNLSMAEIKDRIIQKLPGDLAQFPGGSLTSAEIRRLQDAGLQKFNQPVPNAIAVFFFGKHARNSMTKSERQYLFSTLTSEMLATQDGVGVPAIGFAPPSMFGALDKDKWKNLLKSAPPKPKRPFNVDVFVMKAFQVTPLYKSVKSILERLPIHVNEVVYDPNEPNSPQWKRRSNNDYDLLFAYDESYSPDPDSFWRDIVRDVAVFSAPPRAFVSEAELNAALLESDLGKKMALYQGFEKKCAEDPYLIPLKRFGNELFIAPGVEVAPQEAFGMMVNLWAFKTSL
jgi:MarR-like DNA-binding transcriptional regulator SgrR of sgrS sRNA